MPRKQAASTCCCKQFSAVHATCCPCNSPQDAPPSSDPVTTPMWIICSTHPSRRASSLRAACSQRGHVLVTLTPTPPTDLQSVLSMKHSIGSVTERFSTHSTLSAPPPNCCQVVPTRTRPPLPSPLCNTPPPPPAPDLQCVPGLSAAVGAVLMPREVGSLLPDRATQQNTAGTHRGQGCQKSLFQ